MNNEGNSNELRMRREVEENLNELVIDTSTLEVVMLLDLIVNDCDYYYLVEFTNGDKKLISCDYPFVPLKSNIDGVYYSYLDRRWTSRIFKNTKQLT